MRVYYCGCLLVFCAYSQSQKSLLDSPTILQLFRIIRQEAFNHIGRTSVKGGRKLQDAMAQEKLQKQIPLDVPFPCDVTGARSLIPPTSIHKLRPGDVDIIGAMGDSLIAGNGAVATNVLQITFENRGVSWAGGGQETWREYLTLPNILKVFNPNLFGYALSDSLTMEKNSQFNVAEGAARSIDMPYMAEILVARMKNDPRVNLQKHWKLITIMIGSNDFCSEICWIRSPSSILEEHRSDLIRAFRFLRDNLPRTLIILVITPHLKVMVDQKGRTASCQLLGSLECTCLFGMTWEKQREEYYEIMEKWQDLEEEVSRMPEFQRDNFAIVTQPLVRNVTFLTSDEIRTDWSYFAPDCFHLSQKTYSIVANTLWNNLLEPVGNKSTTWQNTLENFLCPTDNRPFIATWGNR